MPDLPAQSHRMDDLRIAEISGVDYPAHLVDGWLVLKSRQPSQEATVPINKDALDPEVLAHIEGLESEVTKARDDLAEAQRELDEATADPTPEPETTDEDVIKALPAPVRDLIEKANARAVAAETIALHEQETRLNAEFIAKARDLSSLPGIEANEFGQVLKALAVAAPEPAAKVFLVLKAADAALAESGAFTAAGSASTAPAGNSAYDQIESIAKAKVAAGEVSNLADGIAQVAAEKPDLYSQHLIESRKGA